MSSYIVIMMPWSQQISGFKVEFVGSRCSAARIWFGTKSGERPRKQEVLLLLAKCGDPIENIKTGSSEVSRFINWTTERKDELKDNKSCDLSTRSEAWVKPR